MGTEEIKVNPEKVQESIEKLKDISEQLAICNGQNLFLYESTGETTEQIKTMYNEVKSVVGAMKELVDQTITLVDSGNKQFEEADKSAANQFLS